MGEELRWIIGAAFALIGLIGGFIARDRQLTSTIKMGDDVLHDRINRTRDEYLRRDDFNAHMGRIETTVSELRHELRDTRRETNERLDAIISAVNKAAMNGRNS
ncbi:hypothetical protein [Jiella avicenniae]|uniref:Uncharacterized protein n=1 Tax=Jiella avicenniae TaxID=2907202 RepID=A0A9X1T3N5_9HYPH|nr:hypothetical protein [Jiella avicenniae]MCE7026440.1 hypothetical protein [Jiella avicenniae]